MSIECFVYRHDHSQKRRCCTAARLQTPRASAPVGEFRLTRGTGDGGAGAWAVAIRSLLLDNPRLPSSDYKGMANMSLPAPFEDFVNSVGPQLHRTAWLLTRDPSLAEDLTQVALLETWRAWERLTTPQAFARTVLFRQYVSIQRRRWIARQHRHHADLTSLVACDSAIEATPDRLQLIEALGSLPRMQRAVIVLRYLDDLTIDDTAATLRITPGSVKSHTARALAALRVDPSISERELTHHEHR